MTLEYRWVGCAGAATREGIPPLSKPLIVFLHEGLGSVSMWRDFPDEVCAATGCGGLVYSRPGYGSSSTRADERPWGRDFMHVEALVVLPALLRTLGLASRERPLVLFGHSDGASIALIHAAHHSGSIAALVAMAPHIMVEEVCLRAIREAVAAFQEGGLRSRLARHHHDVDATFSGWSGAWLDPAFSDWSIESELARIDCPVLAIQGLEDRYGTLEQIRGIARHAARVRLVEIAQCGHSPHRDQPQRVIDEVADFIDSACVSH
jgi:pimeloyl-ACP methyl ester carboxylesterase